MSKKHTTFVIFGGTGDLTTRKLVPAFAGLIEDGVLAKQSTIIGIARGNFTNDSYRELLLASARNAHEKECISHVNILFYQADSTKKGALENLVTLIADNEPPKGSERIYYLATSYTIFPAIIKNLQSVGLHEQQNHDTKIVFEKPFGHNYESAVALERQIHSVLAEEHVYRIDHYLGKNTVQNINILKFANPFFDAILTDKFVDKIEIFSDEPLGVGNRLGYYDNAGAVKDMIQSHLLQVLSLVLMDKPKTFSDHDIHDAKVKVLRKLKLRGASHHSIGQYTSYATELANAGMNANSKTETYARLSFFCDTPRWRGTRLYLQTGKKLHKKSSKVLIYLKKPHDTVYAHMDGVEENMIVIDIQPDEDVKIYINTRQNSSKNAVTNVPMDFCGTCHFGANTSDGYKTLLEDVLKDDKTLFTRYDELRWSWKIIDGFETMKKKLPLHKYEDGTPPFEIGSRQ